MILLLDTHGLIVKTRNQGLYVLHNEVSRTIGISKIEAVIVSARCKIHTQAFLLLFENDIPLHFLDRHGAVKGVVRKSGFNNATSLRRKQVLFCLQSESVQWVKGLYAHKHGAQLLNLNYVLDRKPALSENQVLVSDFEKAIEKVKKLRGQNVEAIRGSLLGYEGSMARLYWKIISGALPEEFRFEARSKFPAHDPFNAALNYLYGMMYTQVETAIYTVGLDPSLGIFHTDQYQKPTLAFDLIEPFRAWADRFLLEFFWQGKLSRDCFTVAPQATVLNKKGKALIIPEFLNYMEQRTTFNHQICSRKTHISRFAGQLAKTIDAL